MKKTFSAICVITLLSPNIHAQDCKAHFEVNAGPGIDLCEGATVGLSGIIGGGATQAEWIGGNGTFDPNRNSLEAQYTPSEDELDKVVVLVLSASNSRMSKCPAVRAEIKIQVNSPPKADAGASQHACSANKVNLNGSVKGKVKQITWSTLGTGSFDDLHKLSAIYSPSSRDIEKGGCSLMIYAEGYPGCPSDSAFTTIMIGKSPEVETEPEKSTKGRSPVKLSIITKSEVGEIEWNTSGNGVFTDKTKLETTYQPSTEDVNKGTISLTANITSSLSICATTKSVTLHLIPKHADK